MHSGVFRYRAGGTAELRPPADALAAEEEEEPEDPRLDESVTVAPLRDGEGEGDSEGEGEAAGSAGDGAAGSARVRRALGGLLAAAPAGPAGPPAVVSYEGESEGGQRAGEGTARYSNGDMYMGAWRGE
jgi:hypothetical protein